MVERHNQEFPGESNKKLRGKKFSEEWPGVVPPKEIAILPLCGSGRVFIRIDKKGLQGMYGRENIDGPFWYQGVMNPFRAKANIPKLRTEFSRNHGSSMDGFMELFQNDGLKAPWVVAESFLTDGIQVKLQLKTLAICHQEPENLSKLARSGYRLGKEKHELSDVLRRGGVYSSSNIYISEADEKIDYIEAVPEYMLSSQLSNLIVGGLDPGQVKVLVMVHAKLGKIVSGDFGLGIVDEGDGGGGGSSSIGTFGRGYGGGGGSRMDRLDQLLANNFTVDGKQYQKDVLGDVSKKAEENRRQVNAAYTHALDEIGFCKKRTSRLEAFIEYCRVWNRNNRELGKEVLHIVRSHHRFKRFSATQSVIDKIADEISSRVDVLFFGAASFRPQKGQAAAPRKKLVRSIACRMPVFMQCEHGSSCTCLVCGGRMEEVPGEYRILRCENVRSGTCFVRGDRDLLSGGHICKKGVRTIVYNLVHQEADSD
jgi:hypothetical protein